MTAECGFERQAAVVALGALVQRVNEKFGDSISLKAALAGLKAFLNSGIDLKCRSCGWRKSGTKFCTVQNTGTSDSDTCSEFRHLFVVEDK
jgi:hypothetical protein